MIRTCKMFRKSRMLKVFIITKPVDHEKLQNLQILWILRKYKNIKNFEWPSNFPIKHFFSFFVASDLGQKKEEEEDRKPRRCELCPQSFDRTRSLRRHLVKQHDLQNDSQVMKNVPPTPKKPCKRCGKLITNEWSHKVGTNSCFLGVVATWEK